MNKQLEGGKKVRGEGAAAAATGRGVVRSVSGGMPAWARERGAQARRSAANVYAPAQLVVPHLDLVVVAARHEEWLMIMEVNAAHGTVVLVEAIDQRLHAVVPELHYAVVQRCENPRPVRVEGEPLHPVALRLKLAQHRCATAVPRLHRALWPSFVSLDWKSSTSPDVF